jgi:deazaflavin-dependent oxidoreductase (nitroreductase family)
VLAARGTSTSSATSSGRLASTSRGGSQKSGSWLSQHVVKRAIVRFLQKYFVNPPVRLLLEVGVFPPTHALLETTGRRTGTVRHNPVGNGLADDRRTFWIVAEHGRHAGYVRNIEANPIVRVRIGRTWRAGRAHLCPTTIRALGSAPSVIPSMASWCA